MQRSISGKSMGTVVRVPEKPLIATDAPPLSLQKSGQGSKGKPQRGN